MRESVNISVKTDRGEKETITIEDSEWLNSQVREVDATRDIGNSRRISIPKRVMGCHESGKLFAPYMAVLCVDELNKQWWVEGLDKKEMGTFFISEGVSLSKQENVQ